jgi:hypothetical protein
MKASHWTLVVVLLLFTGVVLIPIATYVTGGRVVGPYAGTRGLASYLGSVYADAARGRPLALALLFGPLLAVMVWPLRAWLLRQLGSAESTKDVD